MLSFFLWWPFDNSAEAQYNVYAHACNHFPLHTITSLYRTVTQFLGIYCMTYYVIQRYAEFSIWIWPKNDDMLRQMPWYGCILKKNQELHNAKTLYIVWICMDFVCLLKLKMIKKNIFAETKKFLGIRFLRTGISFREGLFKGLGLTS